MIGRVQTGLPTLPETPPLILVHYATRLPADHDMGALRRWVRERGAIWDAAPDLCFKAFLLREAGHFGATANDFSSVYLWPKDKPFRDWLVRGGFKVITDRYGRADIESLLALDAFRGSGGEARFLYWEGAAISLDTDLTKSFAREIEAARERAGEPGAICAVVALDPRTWRFVRVTLSEAEPNAAPRGVAYQVAHLSRPLLETLPDATGC